MERLAVAIFARFMTRILIHRMTYSLYIVYVIDV